MSNQPQSWTKRFLMSSLLFFVGVLLVQAAIRLLVALILPLLGLLGCVVLGLVAWSLYQRRSNGW